MSASAIRFARAEGAVSCPLGDGVAILDGQSHRYFSLNAAGAKVWDLLPGTAHAVAVELGRLYGADGDQVLADVLAVIDDLRTHKLVTVVDG